MSIHRLARSSLVAALALVACKPRPEPTPREGSGSGSAPVAAPGSGSGSAPAPQPFAFDRLSRAELNRFAVRLNLPIYWIADANHNKQPDPDEIATLRFYPTTPVYVDKGAFTDEFRKTYDQLVDAAHAPPFADARRALVAKDLDQGRATLVLTDTSALDPHERAFVAAMQELAGMLDDLYAVQSGTAPLAAKVAPDPESRSAFRRNGGPRCAAPLTEHEPKCTAIVDDARPVVSVYPAQLAGKAQDDPAFCTTLEKLPNAKALVDPFVVVVARGGGYAAEPYTKAYATQMQAISAKLTEAAKLAESLPDEIPLVAYLNAAAKSFQTNDWWPADEAWAKMGVDNSRWYVRVGPDEVYWEPCSHKAGFHLTFARINQDSRALQGKLTPLLADMENAVAAKAGPPYKARTVKVHLPDFIDIVSNSGNDRTPLGATIGESLPNFGPVANGGRGRTVAMVNLYSDPDSKEARTEQARGVWAPDFFTAYTGQPQAGLISTVLHEATHNLGPAHAYQVGGKDATLVFGGAMASTLEELKAQTGALFLVDLIRKKGIVDDALAHAIYADSLVWACGHISEGMYEGGGAAKKPKPYSQLAAIQLGFLVEKGAIVFDKQAGAANGKDAGALAVPDWAAFARAVDELMGVVAGIKARGDVKAAQELVAKYVDSDRFVPHALIAERFLRFPKASFVYAIK